MTINILKLAYCGKVSAPKQETLTYNIGHDNEQNEFYFRVTNNAGGGFFSYEWIALATIMETIKQIPDDKPFNAQVFGSLFISQSANNPGFLAAALRAEKLLLPVRKTKRLHQLGSVDDFTRSLQKPIKNGVSLPDEIAQLMSEKETKRAELVSKLKAAKAKQATPRK